MKKKKRIIRWIALGVVLTGIVALVVVAGMYSYHHAQTEDIISNFKQTVEQLQEDDGEQEDRSDGKQTGQEAEKQDDNSILNDNNPGNKDWSEGDSYSRLNYPIDKEALRNDSLQYNESLKQNQNLLLKGTNYTYAALDLTKYGIYDNIYGYVSAPSIGLELSRCERHDNELGRGTLMLYLAPNGRRGHQCGACGAYGVYRQMAV